MLDAAKYFDFNELLPNNVLCPCVLKEDDDEEHFQDIDEDKFTAPNEDKIDKDKNEEKEEQSKTSQNLNQGWTFRDQELKRTGYDISCRNPLFCGAQFSSAWEVHPLLKHYHPSVNRFAESILHVSINKCHYVNAKEFYKNIST